MVPLDAAHTRGTPMGARGKSYTHVGHTLPPHRGCPTATRGDSATTTNDAQNTTTRPSPRAPRVPRDAPVFPATQRIVSYRIVYHITRRVCKSTAKKRYLRV